MPSASMPATDVSKTFSALRKLRLPHHIPRFDPVLETAYRISRNQRAARTNLVAFVVIAIVYNVSLFTDVSLLPDVLGIAVFIRLAVVTPIIGLCAVAQFWIVKRNPASPLPAQLSMLGCVVMFSSIMFLQVSTHEKTAAEYFTGCVGVLVGFNSVRYGSFTDQCLGTALMFGIFVIGVDATTVVMPTAKMDATLSVFVCASLILLGAYRSEHVERSSFRAEVQAQDLRDVLAMRNAELHRLSHLDALTGIANRRAFDDMLEQSSQSAGCAVLMIDVDHFKRYNDYYGHPAGDRCLMRIAEVLAAQVRVGDCVARFGGEEFAVILQNASVPDIERIGERLRAAVEDLAIPHAGRQDRFQHMTVSIGGQQWRIEDSWPLDECVGRADAALYLSKDRGRNRLTIHASPT